MRLTPSLLSLALIDRIPFTLAACTRPNLIKALDEFFLDSITKDAVPLTPTAKITENGLLMRSINDSAYTNTTWLEKPEFKVQALDVVACQAARYTVARQKNSTGGEVPALQVVRVAIQDNDGLISEMEVQNLLEGNHMLFMPDKFEVRTPALYNSSQAFPPGAKVNTTSILDRKQLITFAGDYLKGVEAGNAALLHSGKDCVRVINGQRTANHCDEGLENFKGPVTGGRWIADPDTGVVFGTYSISGGTFIGNTNAEYISEFLAVKDGKLRESRALNRMGAKGIADLWPADSKRAYNAL